MTAITKYITRDCELSTSGVDAQDRVLSPWKVTSHVLEQIPEVMRGYGGSVWLRDAYATAFSMDCRRNWTSAGQCFYSDMSHVEICTAETASPRGFAAQCISTLLASEAARQLAEADADEPLRLSLSAANADVLDPAVSWGSHLNVSVSADLWDDLLRDQRHPARLGYVASALAAGIAFFGAGYLLPLKDGTVFSLSARAHHLSRLKTFSTTEAFRRGLLNERREAHAEGSDRLHLIGFDYCLAGAALMCSFVQCLLAAAEEGYCGMILYDPVSALRRWSWYLDIGSGQLRGTAMHIDGRELTLPQYMRELTEKLLEMCESGLISEEVAPEAKEMLPRIIELTHYAEEASIDRCAKHLDWAAKLLYLISGDGNFDDAATRLADHNFANTNRQRGAFWQLWEQGLIDPLVDIDDAVACLKGPPVETRAWGRGQLIAQFGEDISDVNWDCVQLRRGGGYWGRRLRIEMPQLDSRNEEKFATVLSQAGDLDELEDLLDEDNQHQSADPVEDITDHLATQIPSPRGRA